MNIRRAQLGDIKAIHVLLNQLLPGDLVHRKPMWERLLSKESYAAWVAEVDGEPVGFLDLFVSPDVAHGGNTGLIGNLVIDQRFRSQGLGERLVREAIAHSQRAGLVELHLWTEFSNESAIRLYKRLGFRERALLMELELKKT